MNMFRPLLLVLACAVSPLCFAQWQWIDKSGHKVFSDQPPPGDVPAEKILKGPGGRAPEAAPATPAPQAAPAPKVTGRDKELEDRKKQAQVAEAEKKHAQDEEVAKARAENCDRAKRSKATFDSGLRIAQVNDKGEREILDDAQRAAEMKKLESVIARDCKSGS